MVFLSFRQKKKFPTENIYHISDLTDGGVQEAFARNFGHFMTLYSYIKIDVFFIFRN